MERYGGCFRLEWRKVKTDTIAAVATALSNAGIGIIRISGPDAFSVIDRIFQGKKGEKLSSAKSHTVHYGWILEDKTIIDEVMVLVLRAPHTYTREDTIEIDCHGGVLIVKKILEVVLQNGARLAEPGEFTKLAFLSGRIDLTQAEAVMDFIQSENEFARKTSLNQLKGAVSKKVKNLRERILYEIAFIESALDDPEHISLEGYREKLSFSVEEWIAELEQWLDTSKNGKILKEGIKTVILGKPNAGKSSLMNLLAGEERAIVTEIAGTTRDILIEHITLGEISLNVVDTAGIRETEDIIEKIGVEKAKDYAKEADFILYVVDSSLPLDQNDEEILSFILDKPAIILFNKTDLQTMIEKEELEKRTKKQVIPFSAKQGIGVEKLQQAIKTLFFQEIVSLDHSVIITNMRQREALFQALESIKLVRQSIKDKMPEDFYTIDLTSGYEQLGFLIGESLEEDLVNEIFSKFCMGK